MGYKTCTLDRNRVTYQAVMLLMSMSSKRGSLPFSLPACLLFIPLPTLAVVSGMAGIVVVVVVFIFVFQLADVDMAMVMFSGGLHIGAFLFAACEPMRW